VAQPPRTVNAADSLTRCPPSSTIRRLSRRRDTILFETHKYLVFLALFFLAYHALHRSVRAQNVLIVVGSAIFYGWWDVRFLALLFVTAGVDYVAGLWLGSDSRLSPSARKLVLCASLATNLGILFVFKYFDFFASSFARAGELLGWHLEVPLLRAVLPVGISFYTFQSMSYTIDVYRHEIEPERNAVTYFAFVSFFPHMVAGPIQRAHHLIGQLNRPRVLDAEHAREGVWLLCYGYFLKAVVADPAATFADAAFRVDQPSGWTTILGTIAFAIQIYCDFWAYSIIARGSGRLLGVEFIWNFNQPYFATSLQDFWRRWHISLSSWLRDYVYVPLGGNRRGRVRTYANLMVTMLLGGLWHGAAWNFVLWGLLHGVALAVERLYGEIRRVGRRPLPAVVGWAGTMAVVLVGWFLFRCRSWQMIAGMAGSLRQLQWSDDNGREVASLVLIAAPVAVIEVWQYVARDRLAPLQLGSLAFASLCGVLLFFTTSMFERLHYVFIYFQF